METIYSEKDRLFRILMDFIHKVAENKDTPARAYMLLPEAIKMAGNYEVPGVIEAYTQIIKEGLFGEREIPEAILLALLREYEEVL